MSIRTIIEINHDRLSNLENPEELQRLILALQMGVNEFLNKGEQPEIAPGVRVLMQRHHSDRVTLKSEWSSVEL